MNHIADLDSLDGLEFEDDFSDFSTDNSFQKQFDTFFDFLEVIKEFVVDMDITNMEIERFVNQQKDLVLQFTPIYDYTVKINKLLNDCNLTFQDFGFESISFNSIEYDLDKKEYYVQVCREPKNKHYEDPDLYYTYYKDEILSYLNNRKEYINEKILEEMLNILSPVISNKLSYLYGTRKEYAEGRDYMYKQFFFEDKENGVVYLDKVKNYCEEILKKLETYKLMIYIGKNEQQKNL
jgi:hypothetical protein